MEDPDSPIGVISLDTNNLVDDEGGVRPEIVQSFGGVSTEALSVLHGVVTNELGNRGVVISGQV